MNGSIEKHQFKITMATAIIVVLFIIATTVNFATWKTQMENEHQAMNLRQDHLSNGHAAIRDDMELMEANHVAVSKMLENRQDNTDVTMARVETKLASIESLLIEIKQDIKEK